ncbi:MAG: glycosyltransferase [Janthinobacterium lividum]
MLLVCLGYCALWLAFLSCITWRLARRTGAAAPGPLPAVLPRVSILLAARNEAAALPRCLASVRALAYPPHLLEVLLGDDASTDGTAAVAAAAMQGFAGQFAVIPITAPLGLARGKANVLAQLARRAQGDVFFVTDADISLPPTWLQAMLAYVAPGVGTVTGLTVVAGPSPLARLQGLDWLVALALMQVASDSGQPMSAMGNNMLVTRAAYEATGGYEALPFSVTEDFALFAAVNARGYGYRQVFEPRVRAASLPAPAWGALLGQRLRWMRGVAALPARVQAALVFFNCYWLAAAGLLLAGHAAWALGAAAAKIAGQAGTALVAARRAGLPRPPAWALVGFEFYALALTTHVTLRRLLGPRAIIWKDRVYD